MSNNAAIVIADHRDEAEPLPAEPSEAEPRTPAAPVAPPPMRPHRVAFYAVSSVMLFLLQGFGMQFAAANVYQLQGNLEATLTESMWMTAAYMAPYASMALALIKIRTQFGLRRFAEWSIIIFALASVLNLLIHDAQTGIVVRFLSGMAAAPLSTLGFLYMLEAMPAAKKMTVGLALALTNTMLAAPIAKLISPTLIAYGGWQGLYMFELGLALMVFPIIYLLPLSPVPHAKVISFQDVVSYLMLAVGFGALMVVLTVGRFYWWFEAPWLGGLTALSIASLTVFTLIELPRENPMVDIRWIFSPEILHFTAVLLLFRFISSEQTATAAGFHQALGITYDQTPLLYWIILGASVAGGWSCIWFLGRNSVNLAHGTALLLIAGGAWLDSRATNLTQPHDMYLSQAMVAAGAAMFLPTALAKGLRAAMVKGPHYLLSFIVIFLFTQSVGGSLGSAILGTFQTLRQQFHLKILQEHMILTDPFVAGRIQAFSQAYGRAITDKAQLATQGITLLNQQITREANVMAYNDTFLLIATVAATAFVALVAHVTFDRLKAHFAAPAVPITAG